MFPVRPVWFQGPILKMPSANPDWTYYKELREKNPCDWINVYVLLLAWLGTVGYLDIPSVTIKTIELRSFKYQNADR